MITPELVVELAFGSTWQDTSPSWTDVTSYVREASWDTGRSDELQDFSAGTASVLFDNSTRAFDPMYAAGPFYGDLKPMVPMRIRALVNGVYYPRFYGYVDSFPQRYERGNTIATCAVKATDAFKILASLTLPGVYETTVKNDSPLFYWRFGESGGVFAADASGNRNDAYVRDPVLRGEDSLLAFSENGAYGFTGLQGQAIQGPDSSRLSAYPFTIEGWWSGETPETILGLPIMWQYGGSSGSISFTFALCAESTDPADIYVFLYGSCDSPAVDLVKHWYFPDVFDGLPHHFMVVVGDTSASTKAYVDGEELLVRLDTIGIGTGAARGGVNCGQINDGWEQLRGSIDEFAAYETGLTAADALAHYEAGVAPWSGQTTDERFTAVLDLIGWPAALRSIDTGTQILGPADTEGKSALSYLNAIALTEQGRFFVDGDGKLTFHARDRFITQTTEKNVQATFSDDGADHAYAEISFAYDDTYLYNKATVTIDGGQPQTAENTTSQATYGIRGVSIDGLILAEEKAARAVADQLVYRYSEPKLRADGFEAIPSTNAQWQTVLSLGIGDRVNLERTPQGTGTAIDLDCHIESISESVGPKTWNISFTTSPADTKVYFVWGGDATEGWDSGAWL